jgi:alginate O-acetyltransferase complex protein AlgI
MRKPSKIYGYFILVILLTFLVDRSGLLTTINYSVEHVSYGSGNVTSKKTQFYTPLELRSDEAESINIVIQPNGYAMSAILSVSYTGALPWLNDHITQTEIKCFKSSAVGVCKTKVNISADFEKTFVLYSNSKNTIIHDVELTAYKAKRVSSISGTVVFLYFFLLAAFGFLLTKIETKYANPLLICISSGLLISLSIQVYLILILFLVISFLLIKNMALRKKGDKGRHFLTLMILVITVLLLVKLVVPYVSAHFLNPGGMFLAIPLGFSYFIIKIIDMGIDAYKGQLKDILFVSYMAHMLFPATLPAGPIKTFSQFEKARISDYSVVDYSAGIARVMLGVSKKLIADTYLAPSVSSKIDFFVQNPDISNFNSSFIVFEFLIKNFLYIYLDFTAYCDMAIGSARAMGYKVPENFRWPLLRTSISDYWKHWHMTLSSWARKNVFMNTVLATRSLFLATFGTMLAIGLWHKLSLGWLSWAVHHTAIMRIEDYISRSKFSLLNGAMAESLIGKLLKSVHSIGSIFYVWFLVAAGQSFIIFTDYSLSWKTYTLMFMSIPTWLYSIFSTLF